MTKYSKNIWCHFIDEHDNEEDNHILIGTDWPNKLQYYQSFTNMSIDKYSTVAYSIRFKNKYDPKHTFKGKLRYLEVLVM